MNSSRTEAPLDLGLGRELHWVYGRLFVTSEVLSLEKDFSDGLKFPSKFNYEMNYHQKNKSLGVYD